MTKRLVGQTLAMFVSILIARCGVAEIRVATFRVDVTPPIGSPLCDALCPPSVGVNDPLSARGMILDSEGQALVVLVAVDWVGIGNSGHQAWRTAVANAVGTSPDRVCVHTLHQHDAPGCDFFADEIAAQAGLGGKLFPVDFARDTIERVAAAAQAAVANLKSVTHISYGLAPVERVASNRRILGNDGKVKYERMTACTDPTIRDQPEGLVDPNVRLIEFWRNDHPLAVLTYYATHPQSYYRTGMVSADFVGMARDQQAKREGADLHLHFNGAGGNIGAGKYNDGAVQNRQVLADRLAAGMENAWQDARRVPATNVDIGWKTTDVALPVNPWYDEATSLAELNDPKLPEVKRLQAARAIAWGRTRRAGQTIDVARLRIGAVDILHLPGELFVEYQLAAQKLRPQSFVCVAAYGDYGPGYIGTSEAYSQGGYETGATSKASRVAPQSETVLLTAIEQLLH